MNFKNLSRTQKMSTIAIMAAITVLLSFIYIPFPLATFLKIEVSEVIVIIVTLIFGLRIGLIHAFIKSILYFIVKPDEIIGDIVYFFASVVLVVSIYFLYNIIFKNKKYRLFYSLLAATIVYAIVLSTANYFVILPLYYSNTFSELNKEPEYFKSILTIYIPFNLMKMSIVSVVTLLVAPRIIKN